MSIQLRPHQTQAVHDIRAEYRAGKRSPILVMPTGSGKTVIFTYIASRMSMLGKRILILVHRRELVDQVSDALGQWGVEHGIISPHYHPRSESPVQVASVFTLARRLASNPAAYDLVIIDEAHHAARGSTWAKVMESNAHARYLGVTATPCRLDGKGLGIDCGGYFDAMVLGPSVLQLIDDGYLCPPTVYAPPPESRVDLSGIRKRGGDYITSQLSEIMNARKLTGDAVVHYRDHADRLPAVSFCCDVAHAETVAAEFSKAGYQSCVLTGKTPDADRKSMISDLGSGALNVLCSVNTISEGVDVPAVAAGILLRPTASQSLSIQQMGRVLRTSHGKDRAIILDHAGNCITHGLPTTEAQWSLEGQPKRSKATNQGPTTKQCMACYAICVATAQSCPECGVPFAPSKPPAQVVSDDTELVQIDAVAEARARRKEQGMAKSMAELIAIGRARGYKNPQGWAYHVHTSRRGGD